MYHLSFSLFHSKKSSIISVPPNWLTKFHYFISIHFIHLSLFHSKEKSHYTILHYEWSGKFFGALTDPILLYITTHLDIVFVIGIIFLFPYCFLMGIRFSSSCVFIFYIVFSFLFCLSQMFVIRGNYLTEK